MSPWAKVAANCWRNSYKFEFIMEKRIDSRKMPWRKLRVNWAGLAARAGESAH